MTRLIVVATLVGLLCAGAWTLVLADTGPQIGPADATASSSVEKVDGKGVEWWARRARSNGRTARAEARSLRTIRRALRARVGLSGGTARAAGLTQALLCLGRYEGSWHRQSAKNPTHHGRLQMDEPFERTYGREFLAAWGHATNWPAYVQLAVAARAVLSGRGFHPWDQTRGYCGL